MTFFLLIFLDVTIPNIKDKLPEYNENLEGWYDCKGSQNKVTYYGKVMIRKVKNTYVVMYLMEGGTVSRGIAIKHKDILSVSWVVEGKGQGITAYTIQNGGRLIGRWVCFPIDGSQYEETLIFTGKLMTPLEKE